eukprot:gnl/MRDRNA2_/MRDRNA2_131661_c0_seq1.p1 gnl/MRDRNA2_/MRDRNA2_131661_c0~~gnl/MRDRNA2_/MRDRNA2_131661_c0_seq1.p1  ORF type:complete len:781 (+),score=170.91 gnl/MRDRNA2_/MRDRNA2_131661_c0_seq1:76-2418(+)
MAVTSFDGNFSFRQDSLARLGHRDRPGMSADEYNNFLNSPFMQGVRKQDAATAEKTSRRDLKRQRTDPTYKPQDTDWDAPRSHKFDAEINYYKVLGIDEYATMDEVKKAYRHLSLIYHPDKAAGKTPEQKEEHAGIFMELKNAYKTLADNPTRRQYDRERDRNVAGHEVNGYHLRKRAQFDATKVLAELEKRKRPDGKTVNINVRIKLEKVFYGGTKHYRMRRRREKYGEFLEEEVTFRLDCTKGCAEGKDILYRGQGDAQKETQADSLKFIINSKPHEHLIRKGNDIHIRKAVAAADPIVWSTPEMMLETASVGGRYVVVWGRNPFYGRPGFASGELRFKLVGEGLSPVGEDPGALHFKTILGSRAPNSGSTAILVFKNLKTEAEVHLEVEDANNLTIGQVKKRIMDLVEIPYHKPSALRVVTEASRGTYTPMNESTKVGDVRTFLCTGDNWKGAEINKERAMEFLAVIKAECEAEHFQTAAKNLQKLRGKPKEMEQAIEDLLAPLGRFLPRWGFPMSQAGWGRAMTATLGLAADHRDLKQLLTEVDNLCNPKKLADPSRWSADDLSASKPSHLQDGQSDAEQHPAMARRVARQLHEHVLCEVELKQMDPNAAPMYLLTKPSCSITLYSNLRQSAACPQGQIRPRPTFAAVLSCPAGAKKKSRKQWELLCESLAPLIQCSLWKMLPQARALFPKSLGMIPVWDKYGAEWQEERRRILAASTITEEQAKPVEEGKVTPVEEPVIANAPQEPEEEEEEEEEQRKRKREKENEPEREQREKK